jgi:uncharacterized protein YjiS (DUF1127 family)
MLQVVLTQALNRAEQGCGSLPMKAVAWGLTRWQAYRARRRYWTTVNTLQGLDDRTLHDIGVHRTEIESYASMGGIGRYPNRFVARGPFPRG